MSLMEKEAQLAALQTQAQACEDPLQQMQLEAQIQALSREMYTALDAWDRVYLARHPDSTYSRKVSMAILAVLCAVGFVVSLVLGFPPLLANFGI